tara:strand:+ start:1709 stop:1915 length:207 start_codon:yes stop_codon:yes gene_type:complete
MISFGLDKIDPIKLIPLTEILKMGFSRSTIRRLILDETNPLPTVKIKRKVYVETDKWNEYIERQRQVI